MKTNRELRKFGLTMAVAFAILGTLAWWRGGLIWPYLFGIAGFFLCAGLVFPKILAPVEWIWMKITFFLGQIMTRVLLTLTFFVIVTPLGLIMRLFGRDPLFRRFDGNAKSYWIPADADGPASRPNKPF